MLLLEIVVVYSNLELTMVIVVVSCGGRLFFGGCGYCLLWWIVVNGLVVVLGIISISNCGEMWLWSLKVKN